MRAGQLRRRVVLQQRSPAQDATFGQQSLTWVTLATIYASIEPMAGAQLERARSIYNETSHEVTVRWQALFEDIRQVGTYRLVYAGRYFDVGASLNRDERNREVTLLCREGLNEGG